MAEGKAPVVLVGRVQRAIDGELIDQSIFALGFVLGRLIGYRFPPEHHERVLQGALDTIRTGIRGDITH